MLATVAPENDETRRASQTAPVSTGDAGLLAMALQPDGRLMPAVAGAPDVPGYDIIGWLGAGASGEVWLADERETDRIVALKILHRHGANGASAEVLQREIQMLARLVHPNLVLLHRAVTTTDGRQGLATEWIDGSPLDEWLERHPDLSLDGKLQLFHGIVNGVAFLHDHGVIHRDLKPANLIVNTEGTVKIVDFGLARFHQEGTANGIDGGSIGVSGTLHFMAPEQAANGPGARAMPVDVYALGLILYRILTGTWLRPAGATPAETLALVLNPAPLALQGPARDLPRDLQAILHQALAPDPARRYRHARDLEADLDRFAAKQPVAARRHTFLYLTATLLRRQARRSLVAACLVLTGVVSGGVIYHRQRQITERNETNLRYAYTLTSFTLSRLRDELHGTAPQQAVNASNSGGDLPKADGTAVSTLPVDANGQLDLRYYQALLADLHSATSGNHEQYRAALSAIQTALDIYSQLAKEAPDDPIRLLDAAQARLTFARLMDRTGNTEAAGVEARKTLRQLERLTAWPGFDAAPLPLLRCDALRLAAKDAHRTADITQAVQLAREMLATASSVPSGVLVQPDGEVAPRIALAAYDLATYAIAADRSCLPLANSDIARATDTCRAAYRRDPDNPALIRGLVFSLHANVRLALHEPSSENLQPLFEEAANLMIGSGSRARLFSFSSFRDFCVTATAWAGAASDHPDAKVAEAAVKLAVKLNSYVRDNGGGTEDILLQRARLFIYESRLACRLKGREQGAHPASRALRLLRSRQLRDPDRLPLALLTAAALQQAHSLAEFPAAGWKEQVYYDHLLSLLKQLTDRSAELTPEQQQELSRLLQATTVIPHQLHESPVGH